MRIRRGLTEGLIAIVILLLVQVWLHHTYLLEGQVLMPVSLDQAPPWLRVDNRADALQDFAGTDKIVFNYPNVERWCRLATTKPQDLLWNPDNFCGIPFLATQNTHALYPLNAVYLVAGPIRGMLYSAILHGLIASVLTFFLVRRLFRFFPALLLGAGFGGSAWFLAHHDLIQYIHSATWVPLILLGVDRSIRKPGPTGWWLSALGVALSFLGGMPQITVLGLLAAGYWALCRVLGMPGSGGRRLRALVSSGVGILVGLLFSAPQLLPTLEIQDGSGRARIPLEEMKAQGMGPQEGLGLIWPEIHGNPVQLSERGMTEATYELARSADVDDLGETLTERIFYPGMIIAIFALVSLVGNWHDRRFLAAFLFLIFVISALAGSFALDVLHRLPGFQFANHRRLVFLLTALLCFLGAIGAERWMVQSRKWSPSLLVITAVIAILSLGLMLFPESAANLMVRGDIGVSDQTPELLESVGGSAALVAGLVLVCVLLPRRYASWLLLILFCLDLGLLHSKLSPGQEMAHFQVPSQLLGFLQEAQGRSDVERDGMPTGRIIRLRDRDVAFPSTENDLPAMPPNLNMVHGIADAQGYEAIVDRHQEDLWNAIEAGGARHHHLLRHLERVKSVNSPILDLMGVRWVVTNAVHVPGCERVFQSVEERCAVYERPSAMPLLTSPGTLRIHNGSEAVLEEMSNHEAYRPQDRVLVTWQDAQRLADQGAISSLESFELPFEDANVDLKIVTYSPTLVEIEYEADSTVLMRLADTYHPGWVLRDQSGEEHPIVRCDHQFRLAVLPPGKGRLQMTFEPQSLTHGFWLATVGGLFMLLASLWCRRKPPLHAGTGGVRSSYPSNP